MGTTKNKGKSGDGKKLAKRRGSGPVAFFIALFIVALGAIQLVATFHSYALNLAELNGLKRQEAALVAKKQDLENDISRWNDNAYVTAQARERLGFVFPGEQAIHVEHPEAVTGVKPKTDEHDQSAADSDKQTLPWYRELAYGFKKADEPVKKPKTGDFGVTTPSAVGGQTEDATNPGDKTGQANQQGNKGKSGQQPSNNGGQKTGAGASGGNGQAGANATKRH
ncbi:septum formation initiator family protein [Bifidobacterium sp. ESL0682]|uniref:FtsB family cell division protein n=1 Tax=Bifidobacterium sp. ESL0682 TaxID=2983212 RepID=UPI0023F70D4E|nr:septum formation initiator family protein [Bifidobacterium sp. ESL0682]WEV42500.1 septum formation initiator family protein [Bifidobacterium sp. ESL0682]